MLKLPDSHLKWSVCFPQSSEIAAIVVEDHPDYPRHDHQFVELVFVVGGTCLQETALGRSRLMRGSVCLFRPGAWHTYRETDDLKLYNCCFDPGILGRELAWMIDDPALGRLLWSLPLSAGQQGTCSLHLPDRDLKSCERLLRELCTLSVRGRSQHRVDLLGRLMLLLGIVARHLPRTTAPMAGRANPAISTALKLIDDNPTQEWTLENLAARAHVPPNYLVRLFKKVAGLPPMAYQRRRRLELATRLLLQSDLPVSEVGARVGWSDANYFTRRFRSQFGATPTAYRARHARLPMAAGKGNATQHSPAA
ncbi:MAG: AraC family transcriptional regulator [Verrucomicrobia bacterium]|nr:AraC family transcriptional regulator [Verrucomicrobiota bacterium]